MDSESGGYTKRPAQKNQARPAISRGVSMPAGAAATAAVIASFFAAGMIFLPKISPVAPLPREPATPNLEAPAQATAPIEPREARPESPRPTAHVMMEQGEAPVASPTQGPESQPLPTPDARSVPADRSLPRLKTLPSWSQAQEAGPVSFQMSAPPTAEELTQNGSWTQAHPLEKKTVHRFSGKERPDYRAVPEKFEREKVDAVPPNPNYHVKGFAEIKSSARINVQGGLNSRGDPNCASCEKAEGALENITGVVPGIADTDTGDQFNRGFGGGPGVGFGPAYGIGQLTYVGPCETGSVYRLTNTLGRRLGSTTLVGDSGEVWDVKALTPGESVEIRSRGKISSLSKAP